MDMKSKGSAYRRIKGFTLVELIVVIAIISILAGVMNLVTQSFVRNARLETANDNAHLVFTGFQNILTQCEIKQDQSLFNVDYSKGDLEHVVVTFQMTDLNVRDSLTVRCKYKGAAAEIIDSDTCIWTKGDTDTVPGATGITKGEKYKDLVDAILNNFDNTFSGSVRVYIDYDNFEVKSVIYQSWNDDLPLNFIPENNYILYNDWYYGLDSRSQQSDLCAGKKIPGTSHAPERTVTCGVYPYQSDLT